MATFKNIKIKMKGGKTRLQRVKVLASGKYKFVKNLKRKVTRRKTRKTKKRRNNPRKKSRNNMGKGNLTQKAFKLVRYGAFVAPGIIAVEHSKTWGLKGMLTEVLWTYTGFHAGTNQWEYEGIKRGWLPYLASVVVTHGIPKITAFIRRL